MKNKLCVQQLHSPLRRYMPWLIALTLVIDASQYIIYRVCKANFGWWSYSFSVLSSVACLVVTIAFLRSLQRDLGQRLIPIPFYLAVAIGNLLIPFLLGLVDMSCSPLWSKYLIFLSITSIQWMQLILNAIVYVKLLRRFRSMLFRIGACGLASVTLGLVTAGLALLSMPFSFHRELCTKVGLYLSPFGFVFLTCRLLLIMRVTVPLETSGEQSEGDTVAGTSTGQEQLP